MATKIAPSHLTAVPTTPRAGRVVDGPDSACGVLADALALIGRPAVSDRPADVVAAAVCTNPSVTLEELAGRVAGAGSRSEAVASVAAALTGHPSAQRQPRHRCAAPPLALVGHAG